MQYCFGIRGVALVMGLSLCLLFSGCDEIKKSQDDKIKVVATTSILADTVREVGKPYVSVTGLMGPGVDPHLYRASEGDVSRLSKAKIIFYHGLHLESKLADILHKLSMQGETTVAISERYPKEKLLSPEDYEGLYDPHTWFDVQLWSHSVEVIRDYLIKLDPQHANHYRKTTAAYLSELSKLDAEIREKIATVPESQRVLITAHDAFNYFGEAYGFEVKGLQGISTESEAGTRDVQDLAQFIVDRKIRAVFIESSVPKRQIEAVQAAVKAKGWDVAIGGELYSDALGEAGGEAGSYIGMLRHNVETIVSGLTGSDAH